MFMSATCADSLDSDIFVTVTLFRIGGIPPLSDWITVTMHQSPQRSGVLRGFSRNAMFGAYRRRTVWPAAQWTCEQSCSVIGWRGYRSRAVGNVVPCLSTRRRMDNDKGRKPLGFRPNVGRRDLNPRPLDPQSSALPAALRPNCAFAQEDSLPRNSCKPNRGASRGPGGYLRRFFSRMFTEIWIGVPSKPNSSRSERSRYRR